MAAPTDSQFNSATREISMKIDIYFDGYPGTPVTILKSNYLISADILEESGADSNWPMGDISSNELTFTLLNTDDRFSPTNASGPYYGKIVQKVRIEPFFKISDSDWLAMGVFYLFDWNAEVTGGTATCVAYDILWDLASKQVDILAEKNVTHKALFEDIFSELGITAVVDSSLTTVLPWSFVDDNNQVTLQLLCESAGAVCNAGRDGTVYVSPIDTSSTRAIITDGDQIKLINTMQGILKTYGGVSLSYVIPQLVTEAELLSVSAFEMPVGEIEHNPIKFNNFPIYYVSSVNLDTEAVISIEDFSCTSETIAITTNNGGAADEMGSLQVWGAYLNPVEVKLSDTGEPLLEIANKYIQSESRATIIKAIYSNYINADVPTLLLQTRGNPLLEIGDEINAISTNYNTDFEGVIQRAKYTYMGSLSCELTLVNSDVFGGA